MSNLKVERKSFKNNRRGHGTAWTDPQVSLLKGLCRQQGSKWKQVRNIFDNDYIIVGCSSIPSIFLAAFTFSTNCILCGLCCYVASLM